MAVEYTTTVTKYYQRIKKLQKDKVSFNSNDHEVTRENRDNLLNSLLPIIMNLARKKADENSNSVISFEDIIQAGMHGALIAIDKYIVKTENDGPQPAKLSTFAYPWIQKYISEYCKINYSSVSYNLSQTYDILENTNICSGNDLAPDGEGSELFDSLGHANLIDNNHDYEGNNMVIKASKELFEGLKLRQKQILFMSFGIGVASPMNNNNIAKTLRMKPSEVKEELDNGLNILRNKKMDMSIFYSLIENLKLLHTNPQWKL